MLPSISNEVRVACPAPLKTKALLPIALGPRPVETGAGDGSRTRDIDLGKVALYQLSYSRFNPFDSMLHFDRVSIASLRFPNLQVLAGATLRSPTDLEAQCYAGREADAARQEARATSGRAGRGPIAGSPDPPTFPPSRPEVADRPDSPSPRNLASAQRRVTRASVALEKGRQAAFPRKLTTSLAQFASPPAKNQASQG